MVVAGLFPTIKQQQTNWNNNNNNKENLPEMRNHLMTNQPTNQNQIPPLKHVWLTEQFKNHPILKERFYA